MNVRGPDGAVIQFPDDMPVEKIEAAMKQHYEAQKPPLLHAITEGAKEAVEAIPAAARTLANVPGQIPSAVQSLRDDPRSALTSLARGAGAMAIGAIPMQETLRGMSKEESGGPGLFYKTGAAVGLPEPREASVYGALREGTQNLLLQRAGAIIPETTKRFAKAAVRELPGAGVELHSLAIPKAREVPDIYRPTAGAVKQAYDALGQTPAIPMTNFRTQVADILQKEVGRANPDKAFIKELNNYLNSTENGWTFDQIKDESEIMGANIGSISTNRGATPTGTTQGMNRMRDANLRSLFDTIHQDLAAELPNESVAFKNAKRLARRDFAANGLARIIEDNISVTGDQFQSLNTNGIIRELRRAQGKARIDKKAALFTGSWEPGELNSIINSFKEVGGNLPRIPAGKGVPVGSSQRILTGAAGELAAEALGAPRFLGFAGGVVTSELIAQAMMSDAGRAVVRTAMKIDPKVGPVFRNTLASFLRTQAEQARGEQPHDVMVQPPPLPAPSPAAAPTPTPQQEMARASADLKDKQLREADQAVTR